MIIAVPVIKDLIFNRNLPKYEKIVSMINRSEIDVDTSRKRIELPSDYKALAYATFGERDNKGVLTIEFFTGAGFPVKHSGYIYRSDGQLSSDSDIHKRWRYIKRKNPKLVLFFRLALIYHSPIRKMTVPNKGLCENCKAEFNYKLIHNGFNESSYVYCDKMRQDRII
jgi:hypothetical protein